MSLHGRIYTMPYPPAPFSPKVCSHEQLLAQCQRAKANGQRVVHCHGCFDIVHPGHVRHLGHARELGDILLVSLTADDFVNKGASRPMFKQSLRAENLAALSCVDWVYVNSAPTAVELLEEVHPDVYIKGAEYELNEDPRFQAERDAVERHGGRVVFTSGDVLFSSSALINSMSDDEAQEHASPTNADSIAIKNLHRAHDLSPTNIERFLDSMRGRKVVVVGESILDTYVDCAWPQVTGESPVLSLRPGRRVSYDGGAAVIARHLAAMGACPHLITPLPMTPEGIAMRGRLEQSGIVVEQVQTDIALPMKERYMVGREKIFKLDHTGLIELDHRTRVELIETAKRVGSTADAAIVVDFGLGMLGARMTDQLFSALRPLVPVLSGDVSGARTSLVHMSRADWLTPSEQELRGSASSATSSLPAVATELMSRTKARRLAVTMGDEGVVVFSRLEGEDKPNADGQATLLSSEHIPALNISPIDTLGCGDALLALSTMAQVVGADSGVAAYIGSLGAAVCASKIGNHACQRREIIRLARYFYENFEPQPSEQASLAPAR